MELTNSSDIAIVVFACDRYEFLYKGFLYAFREHWPNVVQKKYFVTETVDFDDSEFIHVKSGNGPWSDRLKKVLDQIDESYIILLQEDMWFLQSCSAVALQQCISYVQDHDLSYMKLHSTGSYITEPLDVYIEGLQIAEVDKKRSRFLLAHNISIWSIDFLKSQLLPGEDPWMNERRGSVRLKKSNTKVYQIDLFGVNGKSPINDNENLDARGEYKTVSNNAIVTDEVINFYDLFESKDREYAEAVQYKLEHRITHDGKVTPKAKGLKNKIKRQIKLLFDI